MYARQDLSWSWVLAVASLAAFGAWPQAFAAPSAGERAPGGAAGVTVRAQGLAEVGRGSLRGRP